MTGTRQTAVSILIVMIWAGWLFARGSGHQFIDLSALYVAGHAVATEQFRAVYAMHPEFLGPGTPPDLLALKSQIGAADLPTVPYVYPPLWAWLMAPVTRWISLATFGQAVLAMQVALIALSFALVWRLIRPSLPPLVFALMCMTLVTLSAPGMLALMHNQPQITAMFLTLLAFERLRHGATLTAGAALALAAALKLSPAFFALIFLVRGDWRALGSFLVVGTALALTSIGLAGWPAHAEFLAVLGRIDGLIILEKVNYSPAMLLLQLGNLSTAVAVDPPSLTQATTLPKPGWVSLFMTTAMIAGLTAALWVPRRLPPETALPVMVMALALVTALFGPLSWAHYFLLPMLLLPVLFDLVSQMRAWIWIALIAGLQSLPAYLVAYNLSRSIYVTALLGAGTFIALLVVVLLSARIKATDTPGQPGGNSQIGA